VGAEQCPQPRRREPAGACAALSPCRWS
jgi:hypothetical protein